MPPARIGIVGECKDQAEGYQAEGAPAAPLAKSFPTRHSLSPIPFTGSWRPLGRHRGPFGAYPSERQFMTVRARGVQIVKPIHWFSRTFRSAIILLDLLCSAA